MTDSRIVVFGATGYTGRLTARSLVRRGHAPTLAGRNREAVLQLAEELGGLPTAVADVDDPTSVRALVDRHDVLLSTVGPFARWGAPAATAAIDAGAHYLDSTGEGPFIDRVFGEWDLPAQFAGIAMLTAFGFDYVPGNLAAALALDEAGRDAVSVDVGYFTTGGTKASAGTISSAAQMLLEPGTGHDLLRHPIDGERTRTSISVPGTEQISLPRVFPNAKSIRVGVGFTGRATPAVWAGGRVLQEVLRVPGARPVASRVLAATLKGSGGGPSDEHNARSGCLVTAHAYAADGTELSRVVLDGPSVYGFTAEILAWGAERLVRGQVSRAGALGPVEAFGLADLQAGCAGIGLRRR